MRQYTVSCLVAMALAVGCDESSAPVNQGAVPLQDTPMDVYGRALVGAEGPMRYRDGSGSPAPEASNSSPDSALRSSLVGVQFSLGAYTSRPVGSSPEAVAIGDVTCDGRPDVVMTTTYYFDAASDYRVFVFPQQVGGGLGAPVSYPYAATATRNGIALADLNRDGCLDVVVGHGSGISVLLADKATGGLRPAVVVADRDADTLAAADVNRDGKLDIISLGWSRGASLFHGDGTGAFSRIVPFTTKAAGYNDHEVGDLNGDGIPDLAVMSGQLYAVPNLSVHLHDGSSALGTTPNSYFMGQSVLSGGVGLGDVNGDGRTDVVLSKPDNSPTVLWLMVQDANGNLVGPTTISSYDIPESVQVADIDRDGDDDVVVLHGGWLKVGVYLQEAGALRPEMLYSIPYASHYAPQGLALGDFSGDGCGDIAIADYNNGLVTLHGKCLR
ncbi:VCBS repeat-containing protein [Cystobacter fuscus]|uniref:FG-GAP repeat domain-containing protein n=1 Tax=Cystobacter fuscus TaxID=43 RepID=UPI002B30D74E|nr:VCBS repeat-containing protein [Cystobacter fuscus]